MRQIRFREENYTDRQLSINEVPSEFTDGTPLYFAGENPENEEEYIIQTKNHTYIWNKKDFT